MKKLICSFFILVGVAILGSSFTKKEEQSYYPPVWYEHPNYTGQSGTFGCWTANLHNAGWGDCISSIKVSSGWKVVFYEHKGFGGATFTITSDISNFKDYDWNDAASSVAVYYNGVLQNECVWADPNANKCSKCNGSGDIICCRGESYRTCPQCNGTGKN